MCHNHYDHQVENLQRSLEDCVPRATLEEANRQYNEITAKYVILLFVFIIIGITINIIVICAVIIIVINVTICTYYMILGIETFYKSRKARV